MNEPRALVAAEVEAERRSRFVSGPAIVLYMAAVELIAQLATAFRYGIFRDELYYLACSEHLAAGYVDQPPLIALVAWLERHVGGDSLLSLRFLPALAGAATVWLAGKLARQLGGGRYAQALAALCVLLAPGYLAFFHLLTMNAFEPLIWTGCACIAVRAIQNGNGELWLWFGALSGIGLENKYGILVFGFGVVVGLLLTRERRALFQPWIWSGGLIALLIWLPNLVWNIQHDWPFLQLMRHVRASGRDVTPNLPEFLLQQILFMLPLTAPVWIAGLWWSFFGHNRGHDQSDGRNALTASYRVLGWMFVVVLGTFLLLKGKVYYSWPAFVMMFAAGGVAIEHWLRGWRTRAIYTALLIAAGVIFAPVVLPVLPPYTFIAYETKLHLAPPQVEHQRLGPMRQQLYADMFGWEEQAREVARAFHSLPPEVQAKTGIAAANYGDAGAIDFFGPKYGLPKAISAHQSYWFWGPRQYTGESLLLLGDKERRARQACVNYEIVGHVEHPLSRGDEHFDIYWCHPLHWNLQQIWGELKKWE